MADNNLSGSRVRASPIAGTWYPGQPQTLERTVRELLEAVEPVEVGGRLIALVSPHAGLRYSGGIAAAGYRLLERQRFDTALILGPSHHVYFQGASLYPRGFFETPLGRVPIDEELAAAVLDSHPSMRVFLEAHEQEHCLEMQLPFLQVLSPQIQIVPILMGDQRRGNVEAVADAIAAAVAPSPKRVLLIASSDLSHYKRAAVAEAMDGRVSELVDRFDADGLMGLLEKNHEHACGGGPLVAVMQASRALGARSARTLRYGDSGDVSGDKSEVVGYLSAAVCA